MNKEKIIKWIKILNIIAICIIFPIMFIGFIYITGDMQKKGFLNLSTAIGGGYFFALIFGLLAFKKNYFLILSLIGWIIFGISQSFDVKRVKEENNNTCIELRNNPTCVENECGFLCSDIGNGIGLSTGGSICDDKDMSLCGK